MKDVYKDHNLNRNIFECFKVLSNPVRLDIFVQILEEACECKVEKGEIRGGNCVTQICEKLDLPQSTVSGHVKELLSCGLIYTEKRGKKIYLFGSEDLAGEFKKFGLYFEKEVKGHPHID